MFAILPLLATGHTPSPFSLAVVGTAVARSLGQSVGFGSDTAGTTVHIAISHPPTLCTNHLCVGGCVLCTLHMLYHHLQYLQQ